MEGLGYYEAPFGVYKITSRDEAITAVELLRDVKVKESVTPVIQQCKDELDEYFSRGRKFFTVPLNPQGTAFQNKVWTELQEIPFGTTFQRSISTKTSQILSFVRFFALQPLHNFQGFTKLW